MTSLGRVAVLALLLAAAGCESSSGQAGAIAVCAARCPPGDSVCSETCAAQVDLALRSACDAQLALLTTCREGRSDGGDCYRESTDLEDCMRMGGASPCTRYCGMIGAGCPFVPGVLSQCASLWCPSIEVIGAQSGCEAERAAVVSCFEASACTASSRCSAAIDAFASCNATFCEGREEDVCRRFGR